MTGLKFFYRYVFALEMQLNELLLTYNGWCFNTITSFPIIDVQWYSSLVAGLVYTSRMTSSINLESVIFGKMSNMFYPNEFVPQWKTRNSVIFRNPTGPMNSKILQVTPVKGVEVAKMSIFRSAAHELFKKFCANTSFHSVKYLAHPELHWTERLLWTILVGLAVISNIYISILLGDQFSNSLLTTVIESINYPVSEISYPAVTLCNQNRISWNKLNLARNIFIPNADNRTIDGFDKLLRGLEVIDHATFPNFNMTREEITPALERIKLRTLMEFMMPDCNETFADMQCWWRNKYFNCCSIFAKHRSEYGKCYSFNSLLNNDGTVLQSVDENYPRRTNQFGDWSGLRFTLNSSRANRLPNATHRNGYTFIVHDPEVWPNMGYFASSGTSTTIIIKVLYAYTTDGVENLSPVERQCIYLHELTSADGKTLPGLTYIQLNCISQCRQQYLLDHCGCTFDFLFPTGDYKICNASGLVCVKKLGNALLYRKPSSKNPFFDPNEEGISCSCLPACNRVRYEIDVNSIDNQPDDRMLVDVHYEYGNMMKYRTDVSFGFLDLLVGFGGIAGLFLGCSLLSLAEVAYFMTVGLVLSTMNEIRSRRSQVIENRLATIKNVKSFSNRQM